VVFGGPATRPRSSMPRFGRHRRSRTSSRSSKNHTPPSDTARKSIGHRSSSQEVGRTAAEYQKEVCGFWRTCYSSSIFDAEVRADLPPRPLSMARNLSPISIALSHAPPSDTARKSIGHRSSSQEVGRTAAESVGGTRPKGRNRYVKTKSVQTPARRSDEVIGE
jgi:hypothetical protein